MRVLCYNTHFVAYLRPCTPERGDREDPAKGDVGGKLREEDKVGVDGVGVAN